MIYLYVLKGFKSGFRVEYLLTPISLDVTQGD